MIYDISPPVTPDTPVFPGDTPLSREMLRDMKTGDALTLSTIRATCHLGAHADGPNHYDTNGRSIDEQPLEHYLGRCQVIDVHVQRADQTRIQPQQLAQDITEKRVLLNTATWPDPTKFNNNYAGLSIELIETLAAANVITVGVDTPSVDTASSKDLPAHRAIAKHDIAILEYLDLKDVPAGVYELIALPLKLVGFDASPVRAILRTFG